MSFTRETAAWLDTPKDNLLSMSTKRELKGSLPGTVAPWNRLICPI
jgi:hypothetical protein